MPAPTFVTEYESVWNTTTTPKTISATTAVGDVLVCGVQTENGGSTFSAPTGGTGLTWTLQQSIDIDINWCAVAIYTATATTAETFTLSVACSGGVWWGFNCLRWSGSDGIGFSAKTNVSGAAPSLAFTTNQANSAVCTFNADWNAADGTTRTWRNGETEQTYFRGSANYTVYGGRWNDAGAAGSGKTLGLSAPAGQKYSIIGVEVLGSAGGAPAIPPHLVMATRR